MIARLVGSCVRNRSAVASATIAALFGLAAASSLAQDAAAEDLAVGQAAPSFSLAGSDGASHSLEALLEANRGVVLAWFPKAFTPG